MKFLITGFNNFGNLNYNFSEVVVRKLSVETLADMRGDMTFDILPTEFEAASLRIRELISVLNPDAVVMLGVSGNATGLVLERFAVNFDDSEIADNVGSKRHGYIVQDGPAAYSSTLPLECIERHLREKQIPVAISNHAGTFLCNHVFYLARHELENRKSRCQCGFLHLPTGHPIAPSLPVEEQLDAMNTIWAVQECIDVIRSKADNNIRAVAED